MIPSSATVPAKTPNTTRKEPFPNIGSILQVRVVSALDMESRSSDQYILVPNHRSGHRFLRFFAIRLPIRKRKALPAVGCRTGAPMSRYVSSGARSSGAVGSTCHEHLAGPDQI